MAQDALLHGDETVDLQPLLDHSENREASANDYTLHRRRDTKNPSWIVVLGAGIAMLVIVHVLFVALLRKTTVTLDKLTLPDLCHRRTLGEVVMEFQNPSYCSPVVGPLNITFAKKNRAFLHLQVPAFELQSGVTTMILSVGFELLTEPETFYSLVFADSDIIDVHGEIPVLISCMLVPFTIHLDVSNLLTGNPRLPVGTTIPPKWRYALDPPLYGSGAWNSGVVDGIKDELQRVVTQVLKTIALSNFHTDTDDQEIFAFTDVSFEYASRVLWNLPSLSVKVQSAQRQTILVAGFKRFILGDGQTFISAYTEVFKNQSEPLQSMLQSYLAGDDLVLHIVGGNRETDCYSLQVLDLVDVKVDVPAKIDDKPALLREYSIKPSLKELDSKTHKCLLELKVSIKINNPLPIHFDLYGIELDLLYEKDTPNNLSIPKFLVHINDTKHVSWLSHEENSLELDTAVHDFDTCLEVVGFYLHDQLAFDIQHGHISMGAGSGNFSIPFSVKGIHIHPGRSNNGTSSQPPFVCNISVLSIKFNGGYFASLRPSGSMGASLSRCLCLGVGVAYPAYASFKALERPESGHGEKQWLTYWVVYGASTSVESVASPLLCLVPGYNITKTLFLIWMMSPQTKGATIVYDKLVCPFLKEKEPIVDRKLQEAQEAAESALSSFVRAWGQTIADQVVAIQKSDEFKQICLAIKALASPEPKKRRKKSTGNKSKQSSSEE
ncbi:hypothetical protein L917_06300 [Phytophthora nicotianae]|uniref:Uncharacterized protein n=1 Tax=Phytophthora nicotianae TaxID=4792 RepID=W2LHA4_PHYNI|nr:hypothetical protein L917_06300 [Phytophthora nicotianae]